MIVKNSYDKDFLGREYPCDIIQFYGKDAIDCTEIEYVNDLIREVLFKDCITSRGEKGIVIGYEINEVWMDDYFIIFVPRTNELYYELVNYPDLYKSVEKRNENMCNERFAWDFDSDIGIHSL